MSGNYHLYWTNGHGKIFCSAHGSTKSALSNIQAAKAELSAMGEDCMDKWFRQGEFVIKNELGEIVQRIRWEDD